MAGLTTYTGKTFFAFDIHEEQIDIRDIAHALSFQCRFAGHSSVFYPIAQHCVYASWLVEEIFNLEALMHDSSETYLCDFPTPIKEQLPSYKKIENNTMLAIANKYNFVYPEPFQVKEIDKQLFYWECFHLFPSMNIKKEDLTIELEFEVWDHKKAEENFLKYFEQYSTQRKLK